MKTEREAVVVMMIMDRVGLTRTRTGVDRDKHRLRTIISMMVRLPGTFVADISRAVGTVETETIETCVAVDVETTRVAIVHRITIMNRIPRIAIKTVGLTRTVAVGMVSNKVMVNKVTVTVFNSKATGVVSNSKATVM